MKNPFVLILFVLSIPLYLNGQEVVSPAGGSHTGGSIQLGWTLGEPVISTVSSTQNTLTQGFHQTKLFVTAIDDILLEGLKINVYPNPVTDKIIMEITKGSLKNPGYALFDMNGKLLMQKNTVTFPGQINMQSLATGSYLLIITTKNSKTVQTFKVVKN